MDSPSDVGDNAADEKETWMKRTLLVVLTMLMAAGCDKEPDTGDSASGRDNSASNVAADNTGKNERDQHVAALTPGAQGGSETDLTVTQRIRQGVVDSESLSVNGKNVKIVTMDGVVTLRGPVKSNQEKLHIAAIAQGVDGVKRVQNQLEIAAN